MRLHSSSPHQLTSTRRVHELRRGSLRGESTRQHRTDSTCDCISKCNCTPPSPQSQSSSLRGPTDPTTTESSVKNRRTSLCRINGASVLLVPHGLPYAQWDVFQQCGKTAASFEDRMHPVYTYSQFLEVTGDGYFQNERGPFNPLPTQDTCRIGPEHGVSSILLPVREIFPKFQTNSQHFSDSSSSPISRQALLAELHRMGRCKKVKKRTTHDYLAPKCTDNNEKIWCRRERYTRTKHLEKYFEKIMSSSRVERLLASKYSEPMRVSELNMERHRNEGLGKREIPEKSRRPTASSSTIPTCENPVTRPGIQPGSPWREASVLIAQPPRPPRSAILGVHSLRGAGADRFRRKRAKGKPPRRNSSRKVCRKLLRVREWCREDEKGKTRDKTLRQNRMREEERDVRMDGAGPSRRFTGLKSFRVNCPLGCLCPSSGSPEDGRVPLLLPLHKSWGQHKGTTGVDPSTAGNRKQACLKRSLESAYDLHSERGGAVENLRTRISENMGSISGPAILISVSHCFSEFTPRECWDRPLLQAMEDPIPPTVLHSEAISETIVWSSSMSLAKSAMSSANPKLLNILPLIIIPFAVHSNFGITISNTVKNNFGEMGSPCLTPLSMRKSVVGSLTLTKAEEVS
ncbi:hypothetical protein PR048_020276 [Dryococelus australis]|uniref:Uncharacterized protein n=1 Tax=Dryococelus australis TaxID=614101 RepID=A0ABQ9H677_9NEOP|nr:hypothetical protein PR048_020276 [Dryococelus australis]